MTPQRRRIAVGVCTLSTLIVNIDNTAYQVALSQIRSMLPATFAQGQWILDGYVLTLAALVIVAGAIGDRYNKRSLLLGGLFVYVVGSILTATAPGPLALIAARVIAGIGASILVPVGLAMVRVLARSQKELRGFTGVWGTVVGLGMVTGPLAGGFISGTLGWRVLPVVTAVLAVGFAVLSIVFLPSTSAQTPPQHDWRGIIFLGVAMFSFIGLLISIGQSDTYIAICLLMVVIVIVVYLLVRWRRVGLFPIPEQACQSPKFRASMYVAVGNYFCVGGAIFLLATVVFQESLHLSVMAAGVGLVPLALGYATGSRISPALMGRSGTYQAVIIAGLLMFTSTIVIAILIIASASVVAVSLVGVILGAGMGMANTPTNVLAMSELPVGYAGASGAFASAARQVGQATGIAVCGSAYSLAVAAGLPDAVPWIAVIIAAATITLTGILGLAQHSRADTPSLR